MLNLILHQIADGIYVYKYFPESKDIYGVVSIDAYSGKTEIKQLSTHPFDKVTKNYALHAINRLRKYRKEDEYKEEDFVAWG